MAVGFPVKADYVTGDVLTAANMNDLSGSVNLLTSAQYAAGKNAIINGAFDNWQRGTSISLTTGTNAYGADRFINSCTFSAGTSTVTRQTFTPGTAPVAGYESQYFSRLTCGSTTTVWAVRQRIENVQSFAGQTVTLSFWVKASAANATTAIQFAQVFGSGGSSTVTVDLTGPSITTSWQRFTVTTAIPSISGKTVGTSSYLEITVYSTTGIATSLAVDTWGWQVEAGSTATAFQTATGTLQGELAACQRYYYRQGADNLYQTLGTGIGANSTTVNLAVILPSQMRVTPTTIDFSTIGATDVAATNFSATNAVINNQSSKTIAFIGLTFASGITANRVYFGITNNSLSGFLGISAEL